jgi:hypothetical protein
MTPLNLVALKSTDVVPGVNAPSLCHLRPSDSAVPTSPLQDTGRVSSTLEQEILQTFRFDNPPRLLECKSLHVIELSTKVPLEMVFEHTNVLTDQGLFSAPAQDVQREREGATYRKVRQRNGPSLGGKGR